MRKNVVRKSESAIKLSIMPNWLKGALLLALLGYNEKLEGLSYRMNDYTGKDGRKWLRQFI